MVWNLWVLGDEEKGAPTLMEFRGLGAKLIATSWRRADGPEPTRLQHWWVPMGTGD